MNKPIWCNIARVLVVSSVVSLASSALAAPAEGASVAEMIENKAKLASMQPGFRALAEGRAAEAFLMWHPIADAEFAPAQFALGILYERGRGVPQDLRAALRELWAAELNGLKRAKKKREALQKRLPLATVREVSEELRKRLLARALDAGGRSASALAELAAAAPGEPPAIQEEFYVWKALAAALGDAGAAKARDEAAASLEAARLLELQALASAIFAGSVPTATRPVDYPRKDPPVVSDPSSTPSVVKKPKD